MSASFPACRRSRRPSKPTSPLPCPPSSLFMSSSSTLCQPLSVAEEGRSRPLCAPVFRQPSTHLKAPSSSSAPAAFIAVPEPLDPGDAATLEEEAARYHSEDWPPLTLSAAPLPPSAHASALPPSFLVMKSCLTSQIQELTKIPPLHERFSQLSALCSSAHSCLPQCPPVHLAFPVTRSQVPRETTPSSSPLLPQPPVTCHVPVRFSLHSHFYSFLPPFFLHPSPVDTQKPSSIS